MRITRVNPKATRVVKASTTYSAGLSYANRISRLDECQHLTGNDPTNLYVKMNILVDLIHPSNILTQHSHIAFAPYPEN
jgi:hypothetical protein